MTLNDPEEMSVFQFHGTVPPTLGFGEGLYTSTKITPFGSQIDLKLFIWMHKIITLGHKYFKDLCLRFERFSFRILRDLQGV